MKENILRALSLVLAVGGILVIILTGGEGLSSITLSAVLDTLKVAFGITLNLLVLMIFLLFAVGGSKLLDKLPLGSFLNQKVATIFTTGRQQI